MAFRCGVALDPHSPKVASGVVVDVGSKGYLAIDSHDEMAGMEARQGRLVRRTGLDQALEVRSDAPRSRNCF